MPGDVGTGMGKENAGGGFAGKVPGYGLYGGYQGHTADKGTEYWFDASDGRPYHSVWMRNGSDGVFGWDGDRVEKLRKLNRYIYYVCYDGLCV